MCRNYRTEKNEYFCFALKKGSIVPERWKETAQICCLYVQGDSLENNGDKNSVMLSNSQAYRLVKTLTYRDFCNVCHTFSAAPVREHPMLPHNPALAAQLLPDGVAPSSASAAAALFNASMTEEGKCCVCFDRPTDLLLPCLHSFCTVCVIQWKEYRPTFMCPVCKAVVHRPFVDSWEVAEVPDDDEILDYFRRLAPLPADEEDEAGSVASASTTAS